MSTSLSKSVIYDRSSFITNYHGNGGGRDSYIAFDNGGFNAMYEPTRFVDIGTTYVGSRNYSKFNMLSSSYMGGKNKSVNYRSDGSGRDSYIL